MKKASSFLIAGLLATVSHAATSLTQYGITWTFAADMATGQFANDCIVSGAGAGWAHCHQTK